MEAMSVETAHDFGFALRKARKEAGLSQMRLAEMCGCSQRFVSEVERGKQTAELGRALKLLESLRVPITIGTMRAGLDGRAEVRYAVTRIASELEKGPKPKRSLASYLEESDGR